MKTPHLFNPSRAFASLRVVAASACVLAAAALAFVAMANNNSSAPVSKNRLVLSPLAEDSLSDETGPNSVTAAQEDYAKRAYPADQIDLGALINAQAGYQEFLAHATPTPVPTVTPGPTDTPSPTATPTATPKGGKKGGRRGKGTPTPTPTPVAVIIDHPSPPEPPQLPIWQEVTGHTAIAPNVLTRTGSGQVYSGRITALAIDTFNGCNAAFCRVWVGAAGGGIWVTFHGLDSAPTWFPVSGFDFVTNAIGTITYVNNGTVNGVLYVGTGEGNTNPFGDTEAGVGVYRSTDGGNTWTALPATIGPITTVSPNNGSNGTYTGNAFLGRSISSVVVDPTNPNILYVASALGVRNVDSVNAGGTTNPTTPRPPIGVFKSVDGGQTFAYIFDGDPTCGPGTCLGGGAFSSFRGFTELELDPSNHNIVYASDFPSPFLLGGGIWRSLDGGNTWAQIKAPTDTFSTNRCAFDVTSLGGGVTRMYAGCGSVGPAGGAPAARVFRSDNAQAAATFTDLTALELYPATINYCTGQCFYDNFVVTPPGFPNIVYVGGSYTYNECGHGSDCRGVVMAQDAGASGIWNDMTWDARDNGSAGSIPFGGCCQPNAIAPNGMHPDMHALVTVPGNPFLWFEGSDGGLVRSPGTLTNISAQCATRTYPAFTGTAFQCNGLLGAFGGGVPTTFSINLNSGLRTLQLQSISVASDNVNHVQFGTQDNGTWDMFLGFSDFFENHGGDGGQSGFSVTNSALRVASFFNQNHFVNFHNGNPTQWDEISLPIIFSGEHSYFYPPLIVDPTAAFGQTIFEGSNHVWRTQDWGGNPVFLDANCNENTPILITCGDFVPLGGAANTNDQGCLTCAFWGTRAGQNISVIAREPSNTNTAWAATGTGRVFISDNINGAAAAVVWNRVDANGANGDPNRVVTGIAVDPANPHHAFISYCGYNFNTPAQKGHVFSVTWGGAGAATFTDISFNIWDIPITGVAYDNVTGDVYASSDFVVFRLAASNNPATQWFLAGLNMPMVETAGLTIIPGSRVLYAATHGRGVWKLNLP